MKLGLPEGWRSAIGLYRAREGRLLGGVCAGLSRRFGVPVWLLRIGFVLGNFLPGPGFLVYMGLWLALPLEPEDAILR